MNNTTIKDSNSLNAVVWPGIENKGYLTFIPKQNYFTVITKTEKAGGILANSISHKLLTLKNLRIQLSILQEAFENTTENSCKYTKLAQQFFQNDLLLNGVLPNNKEVCYCGKVKGFKFKN